MRGLIAMTLLVGAGYVVWNDQMENLIPRVESKAVEFSLMNIETEAKLSAMLDGAPTTAGYMQAAVAGLPERVRASIVVDGDSIEQTIGSVCRRLDPHPTFEDPAFRECEGG